MRFPSIIRRRIRLGKGTLGEKNIFQIQIESPLKVAKTSQTLETSDRLGRINHRTKTLLTLPNILSPMFRWENAIKNSAQDMGLITVMEQKAKLRRKGRILEIQSITRAPELMFDSGQHETRVRSSHLGKGRMVIC